MSDNAKVVIIGLDGATFSILRPLVDAGVMPTIGRFMREGAWGPLHSTRPPVTCPAWPSMYTGVAPGKHGVFSFSYRETNTGRVRTAAVTDVRARKLWDLVGDAGLASAVLNVPITFPAQRLSGVMLTGFVSPDDSMLASYPPEVAQDLRDQLGELKLNWEVLGYRPAEAPKREAHVRQINELLSLRIAQFERILDQKPADFVFFVHEYTDRVYHLFNHILDPAREAHHDPKNAAALGLLHEGHRSLDASIQRLIERFGPRANYMIVSDHGFGSVTRWVYLNNLLERAGLARLQSGKVWADLVSRRLNFSLKTRQRLGVEPKELWHRQDPSCAPLIDFRHSKAFGGPQLEQAVYVNSKDRFPGGIVERHGYDRVRQEIIDCLAQARDPETGTPIFQGVWSRDEVYPGPFCENAPDVVYELSPGYMVSNAILPPPLLNGGCLRPLRSGWDISGYHRPEGVFLGLGPAFKAAIGFEASILDVAPTVLYLLDLPIPEYMDGDIIRRAIKPELLEARDKQTSSIEAETSDGQRNPYSEAEQLEVIRRLEQLGYL